MTSSVMMKIVFTQEFQKIQHLLHLTLLSLSKTFLQSQPQNLILIRQIQLPHKNLSYSQHIFHKSFHFMTPLSLKRINIFQGFFLPDDDSSDIITLKQQQTQTQ